jgi:hypothetical protein
MQAKLNAPNENRRKLVQGTLAAPLVLTVSSASATAVTSFGKCMDRLTQLPQGAFFALSADADIWMRKQVPIVQLKHGNDTDWFYFDPGLNDYVRLSSPTVATGIGALMKGWQKTADGTRWALVWVNSGTGTPFSVMQVQRPAGYQASTMSCYTSLARGL